MDRRDALKLGCVACGTALLGSATSAYSSDRDECEFVGVLVDTHTCTGCRKCEEACAEVNGLPVPDIKDKSVFEQHRRTTPSQWTVTNRFQVDDRDIYVKKQCMHCNQPGCASACLVKAMEKTKEGPIIWNGSKCMGCRYCMISCAFNAPKFEYDSANPKIQKCIMCYDRLKEGKTPACVEACPVEALTFGTRRALMDVATTRIYKNPDSYVKQIYGECEIGGTGWMYISPVPFEKLGFKTDLGKCPAPELTKEFLYSVPVVLLLWPAFLYGVSQRTAASEKETLEAANREGK